MAKFPSIVAVALKLNDWTLVPVASQKSPTGERRHSRFA
jgi:hypothetical protein